MNNQTMFMLGGLATLVLILVVVFMPSMETYSREGHFLTMDKKGEIKLHPVVNYQPAGNYLTRGKFYRIWNKEGGLNVLRWGDQIKADGNKNAKNQYRYFKIDN